MEFVTINNKTKIAIPVKSGIAFTDINQIIKIESKGNNSLILLSTKEEFIAFKALKYFEEALTSCSNLFFRCHKCYIINLSFVKHYNKNMNFLQMEDGSRAEISRRKKEEFLNLFTFI